MTEAADGPSSLRAVFQHSADLVILDLGLPGVDGPEVLVKIRRHSAVPVIVCSGRDSEEERIRMLNLGAATCLGHIVQIALGVRILQVDGRWDLPMMH